MSFARESIPLVLPVAALSLLAWLMAFVLAQPGWRWAGAVFCILAVAILLFFRDPERVVPQDPRAIVSPADGKVMTVETLPDGRNHVSIFLSVFDVHINRIPYGGTIRSVQMEPGTYLHAGSPGAEGNAKCTITAQTDRGELSWRQVSGLIARKISCRIKMADQVRTGDRFGLIYFGSRMDVYYPAAAQSVVAPGDRVVAGETIVAKFTN